MNLALATLKASILERGSECTSHRWEKILANYTSDKGLVSKMYTNTENSTLRKQTTQLKSGETI